MIAMYLYTKIDFENVTSFKYIFIKKIFAH